MSDNLLKDLRDAVAAVIRSVQPEPIVVIPRWIAGFEGGRCPNQLRLEESRKIHGWLVKVSRSGRSRAVDEAVGLFAQSLTIEVWGFYSFDGGDDDGNSADAWELEYTKVQDAFSKADDFLSESLTERSELEFQSDVFTYSGELVHVARGSMEVALLVRVN